MPAATRSSPPWLPAAHAQLDALEAEPRAKAEAREFFAGCAITNPEPKSIKADGRGGIEIDCGVYRCHIWPGGGGYQAI